MKYFSTISGSRGIADFTLAIYRVGVGLNRYFKIFKDVMPKMIVFFEAIHHFWTKTKDFFDFVYFLGISAHLKHKLS